jgi:hypothetical protein
LMPSRRVHLPPRCKPEEHVAVPSHEVFFQLPYVEEVSYEPRLIAATFPADLLDDQLRVPLHEELSDPQG